MSDAAAAQYAALVTGSTHLQAAKYFQLAAFVFLVYDHIITFSDEVRRIWRQPWTGATVLFALNRYITPLQFTVILVAFHSEAWTNNIPACEHFVRFEGGSTLALVAICEVIMMMRVYALWQRDRRILLLMIFLWVAQVGFSGMAMTFSKRVALPPLPGFVGCILTGNGSLFIPFWVMPLITDTVVFGLTLWRTRQYARDHGSMPMLELFARDGALYFFCIFAANLLNVVLFLSTTGDLKAIGASFSQIITSVLISRLVLNLRILRANLDDSLHQQQSGGPQRAEAPQKSFVTTLIGNLGNELDDTEPKDRVIDISRRNEVFPLAVFDPARQPLSPSTLEAGMHNAVERKDYFWDQGMEWRRSQR